MKLLICTQTIDQDDPVLGFFVRWVAELAKHCEQVTVICLRTGAHTLPPNVRVFGLGGGGKISRAYKLIRGAYRFRGNYDAVFVHMNQEYVLAAGWLWRLLGKPVHLWRNHYAGSLLTSAAALFCKKIFYTSASSYTAAYRRAAQMPVGVDIERFRPGEGRVQGSILSLGRVAPSKRLEMLLAALPAGAQADIVGPADPAYLAALKKKAGTRSRFLGPVSHDEAPALYAAHDIFVNCSPPGMFDKTLFEAAACGCIVLASSRDWAALMGPEFYFADEQALAAALARALALPPQERDALRERMRATAAAHSLKSLAQKLVVELS